MKTEPLELIVWCDLETTGLDLREHVILQLVLVVTDEDLNEQSNVLDLAIHQPKEELDKMGPVVREMHARTGLLDRVASSRRNAAAVDKIAQAFLRRSGVRRGESRLAGSSVYFDRSFLMLHMSDLHFFLHHRCLDVSSVKESVRLWNPAIFDGRPPKQKTHEASSDIRESIAEQRYYVESLLRREG